MKHSFLNPNKTMRVRLFTQQQHCQLSVFSIIALLCSTLTVQSAHAEKSNNINNTTQKNEILAAAGSPVITLDLQGAINRAMTQDHRIGEKQALVGVSQGQLAEAEGALGVQIEGIFAVALAPDIDGGIFERGTAAGNNDNVRDDSYDASGVGPWFNAQARLIQPLYTFGKGYHYKEAAKNKITVDTLEVTVQKGQSALDVTKAYYGYLTARSARLALESTVEQLQGAQTTAKELSEQSDSKIKQADLYNLNAGISQARKFLAQAEGLELVAMAGLRALTNIPTGTTLELADKRLRPLPLPEETLSALQSQAIQSRPEMAQLEAGLKARRALVEAKNSEQYPNIFAGIIAGAAYSPDRDTLDNPFITDPFNYYAATPLVGIQWEWQPSRQNAIAAQEEAELAALVEKKAFAMQGIPFEVAETYYKMQASHKGLNHLESAVRDSRRALNTRFLDFKAGLEEPKTVIEALRDYTLLYSDYLLTVNDYNMQVITLQQKTAQLDLSAGTQ